MTKNSLFKEVSDKIHVPDSWNRVFFLFFSKFLLGVFDFFFGYLGEFLKVLLSTGLDWMCCNGRQAIFLSGFLVSVLYSFHGWQNQSPCS
jgi:hypothetical protein